LGGHALLVGLGRVKIQEDILEDMSEDVVKLLGRQAIVAVVGILTLRDSKKVGGELGACQVSDAFNRQQLSVQMGCVLIEALLLDNIDLVNTAQLALVFADEVPRDGFEKCVNLSESTRRLVHCFLDLIH
jgi:hypothetical protein